MEQSTTAVGQYVCVSMQLMASGHCMGHELLRSNVAASGLCSSYKVRQYAPICLMAWMQQMQQVGTLESQDWPDSLAGSGRRLSTA